jgi:CheY-like chemotaxis protein
MDSLAGHDSPTRVLVVDDHDLSRRYTAAALRQSGADVKAAACPDIAFDLALNWRPQAIFVDLRLPGTSGFEWMDRVRHAWPAAQPRPRLIVLSACHQPVPGRTPAGTRIDAALVKPAAPDALRQALGATAPAGVRERRGPGPQPVPDPALTELFLGELATRLRELDRLLGERNLAGAIPLMHRLIASARICRAERLEAQLANLRELCRSDGASGGPRPTAAAVAHRYHALREAAAAAARRHARPSG